MIAAEGTASAVLRCALVTTGGTIAGQSHGDATQYAYTSAQLGAEQLLMGVPALLRRASWEVHTPYSIGSQNLELGHMLRLRAVLCQCLENPEVDAVLVTHGTDTLEDMLYFLYLTLPPRLMNKPVVFTAAMLPSDHPQADGPSNLLQAFELIETAVQTKLNKASCAMPFGLVMQGLYTPAHAVEKLSTASLDAFDGPHSVEIRQWPAHVQTTVGSLEVEAGAHLPQGFFHGLIEAHATEHPLFESLEVALVFCQPGNAALRQLKDLVVRKPAAVIVAAPGHGNVPDLLLPVLRKLLSNGVDLVRASRVPQGGVLPGGEFFEFEEYRELQAGVGQFSESEFLSLNKMAVLARLRALARSLSQ
ncbi:asparaginase domain-containing protein [Limnobacter sp.]|uniref:asparaginase domain-containing protein n=1 Tax=Limnobacter sp. TaxID=2003368 RepID=UPI00351389D5